MGAVELAVVLVVAFLVLGPGKSIELARGLAKTWRDLRRTFSEAASALDLEEPPPRRTGGPPPAEGREEAGPGGRK
jgi:Sec-independent protein translocase protein TatA